MSVQIKKEYPQQTSIYALIDPETSWFGYIGRTNNPSRRHQEHIHDGYRHLSWIKSIGFFLLPITFSKANWISFLLAKEIIPEILTLETFNATNQYHASKKEEEWIGKIITEGHPISNGKARVSFSTSQSRFNPFELCPYTPILKRIIKTYDANNVFSARFLFDHPDYRKRELVQFDDIASMKVTRFQANRLISQLDLLKQSWTKASQDERSAFLTFINRSGQHAA